MRPTVRMLFAILALLIPAVIAIASDSRTPGAAEPVLWPDKSPPQAGDFGDVTVVKDKENWLGSEITGAWAYDADLCKSIYGKDVPDQPSLTFSEDEASAKKVLEAAKTMLDSWSKDETKQVEYNSFGHACRTVAFAGKVEVSNAKHEDEVNSMPCMLIVWRGNPCLMLLYPSGKLGDCPLSIARDFLGDNDVMFYPIQFLKSGGGGFHGAVPLKRKK